LRHFEPEVFGAVASRWRGWAINAQAEPLTVIRAREIIFERVPSSFRLIEPVHVPDPLQIVSALGSHEIDDMAIGFDVTSRPFLGPTIPFSVPGKPIAVWFRAPFDQDGRAEMFRVARPGPKIDIELTGDDLLQREYFLGALLIDIRAQHQAYVRQLAEGTNPSAHFRGKSARLEPVVGEINPRGLFAEHLFITRDIGLRHVVFGRVVVVGPDSIPVESVIKFAVGGFRNCLRMSLRDEKRRQKKSTEY